MSWAKFDDLYDDNRKIKRAWRRNRTAIGVHAMAVTYSARHETDGHVDQDWIEDRLPAQRERDKVIATLLETGLFEQDDDGFKVHDYLDYNDSRETLTRRRRKDRQRKGQRNPTGNQEESTRNPEGIQEESEGIPASPAREGAAAGDARGRRSGRGELPPTSGSEVGVDARALEAINQAEAVLRQCDRLHVDRVGIENAVAAWPGQDPVAAARTVVTWVTDPSFRSTNGAKLLGDALSKQQQRRAQIADIRDAKNEHPADRRDRELAAMAERLGGAS